MGTINRNSKVTAADNAATNGVVHIIDTVLVKPACKKWCASNGKAWGAKCTWMQRCDGCPECSVPATTKARPVCKTWCAPNGKTWEKKCNWATCGGCPECSAGAQKHVVHIHRLPT